MEITEANKVKLDFIDRQLIAFHELHKKVHIYKDGIEVLFVPMYKTEVITPVSYYANFRDVFWHYRRCIGSSFNDEQFNIQCELMLEHLNRAVSDMLIDLLQKLFYVNGRFANSFAVALRKDDEKHNLSQEELTAYTNCLEFAKNGYLSARKALVMLRDNRSGIERIVYPDNEKSISSNEYNMKIISLFEESFEFMQRIVAERAKVIN